MTKKGHHKGEGKRLLKSRATFKNGRGIPASSTEVSTKDGTQQHRNNKKDGSKRIREIDYQLLQMKERSMKSGRQGGGASSSSVGSVTLQPSLLREGLMQQQQHQPAHYADLLLQGESLAPTAAHTVPPRDDLFPRLSDTTIIPSSNMFAALDHSDDEEECTNKYKLQLQPSLLAAAAAVGPFTTMAMGNRGVADDDDDDDL